MYQLRRYQQEAVDNTVKYFQKKRDPAVIVLPTGAGTSLVIAELTKIAKGRVLVLALTLRWWCGWRHTWRAC